jgi:signal transduction histidine kinase
MFEDVVIVVEELLRQQTSTEEIKKELEKWVRRWNSGHDNEHEFINICGIVDDHFFLNFDWDIPDDYDPKTRPWYIGANEHKGQIYCSDPYKDAPNGKWILSLSKMLYDTDNNPVGVLAFGISLVTITKYVDSMQLMNHGYGGMLDSNMRFIVHPDESAFGRKLEDLDQELVTLMREHKEINAHEFNNLSGVNSILFGRPLFNGWYIYVSLPYDDYYRDVHAMLTALFLTGLASTIMVCGFLTLIHTAKFRSDEANRLKSSFLANMSHEIRTPMNAIIGITQLLAHSNLQKREREYVKDIEASARSLLSIINDILDLAKIESGKLSLNPVHYDFCSLMDNVESMFSYVAKKNRLEFKFESDGEMPPYQYGDDIKLRQVLTNICGNAIKYTEKGYVRDLLVNRFGTGRKGT